MYLEGMLNVMKFGIALKLGFNSKTALNDERNSGRMKEDGKE